MIAQKLTATAAPLLGVSGDDDGRHKFYLELKEAKFGTAALLALSTDDLLRQDYKQEIISVSGGIKVGFSSSVLPLRLLLGRQSGTELDASMASFTSAHGVDLSIMTNMDVVKKERLMLLHCSDASLRDALVAHLEAHAEQTAICLLYTSPSPRD